MREASFAEGKFSRAGRVKCSKVQPPSLKLVGRAEVRIKADFLVLLTLKTQADSHFLENGISACDSYIPW
jgi:hypothetical protein